MAADHPVLTVHRHAGEIADMLLRACQLVEKGGLSAILLSGQSKCKGALLRQRAFVLLGVVFALLADAGMRVMLVQELVFLIDSPRLLLMHFRHNLLNRNKRGLRQTEREAVVVQRKFHRVAHRSQLHHRDSRSGDHTHVQQVAPHRATSADTAHQRCFSNFQILECHVCTLSVL